MYLTIGKTSVNAPAHIKISDHPSNPAEKLMAMAKSDMEAVNGIILERMKSPVGMIPDLAEHLVAAGGKRLRPLLTIAGGHLCGDVQPAHHKLAAAVEFIHSATLLHDDVIDDSDMRRGRKVANRIWGNSASILVGDFLFARSFNLMVETGSLRALDILSTASSVIAEGEVHQLASLRNVKTTEATYLEVISAKTAALFAAACEVSAVITDIGEAKTDALRAYGQNLGLAFQLVDDALDYGGFEVALGKSVGDDFREGKLTLPVIRAIQSANSEELAFWQRVMSDRKQESTDFERAVSIIRRRGTLESTLELARDYAREARTALDVFDDGDWKKTLMLLADYVVDRIS
ncbi:MAG: polyprenyl synthetase family protein [Hellea sp.]|nr:polyprenyl synthetase family protein [Hellea sp.]